VNVFHRAGLAKTCIVEQGIQPPAGLAQYLLQGTMDGGAVGDIQLQAFQPFGL
jgi:hypothetical protein